MQNMSGIPSPQQPQYSTESKMAQAPEQGITPVNVNLDADSLRILQECSPIYHQVIVNMGIQLLAKTNMYKEYMLLAEYSKHDKSSEPLEQTMDVSAAVAQSQVQQPQPQSQNTATPAAAPKAGGFTAW